MRFKSKAVIFFVAFFFCVFTNEVNKLKIKRINPTNITNNSKSLVYNSTIWSVDNDGYVKQAQNFLQHKGFNADPRYKHVTVRRTPGYPVFYLLHYYLLGRKGAHIVIPYTQSIIFAFSALFLALSFFIITDNFRFSMFLGLLYGCNPFTTGFAYYTITEAIHPAFTIFSFYFFIKLLYQTSFGIAIKTGVVSSITTLIRASNGLLAPAIIISFFMLKGKSLFQKTKTMFVFGLGFSFLILCWGIRNFAVVKEPVLLEKFYHEDPMAMGKSQSYLSKWWMCWGNPRPEIFTYGIIEDIKSGKNNFLDSFLLACPSFVTSGYTKEEMVATLLSYKECVRWKIDNGKMWNWYGPKDSIPNCEEAVSSNFKNLINKFKRKNPFRYYITSPLYSRARLFITHSFSAQWGSLNPDKTKLSPLIRMIKSGMYLFNVVLFLNIILFLFSKVKREVKFFILFFSITTILFFSYNVHIEARYSLAIYPFLYFMAIYNIYYFGNGFLKKHFVKK